MSFSNGPTIVTNGLVLALDAGDRNSYVSGSSTWFDLVGSSNGTLTNGPTFDSGSGGSIIFDGVDDYVQYPVRTTYTEFQYSSSFTIECFVKITESSSLGYVITNRAYNDGNGTRYTGWGLLQNEGSVLGFVGGYPSSTFDWRRVTSTAANFTSTILGKWAHITWTNDGTVGGGKLYFNGVNVTSQSFDDNTPPYTINYSSSHKITLGMSPAETISSGGHFLSGSIASARIYTRALSADEVLQNYNAQKSKFGL